ncbi:MAG: hypothetical protein JO001_24770 [Alphaproteobacteria bacterium]|nr:hypothetical protein [Alphaproteobacteria bacterium]
MLAKVDLHLRLNPGDEHRNFGVVGVECDGPEVAPYQDIACHASGLDLRAHITSVHRHGNHVPHVYADAMAE